MTTYWQLGLISALAILCCSLLETLYNVFFHPLRKYPGPWYLGASRLFLTRAHLGGSYLPWLRRLHDHYGHVVRVAPNEISYTHPDAWADICAATPLARYGMDKDPALDSLVRGEDHSINPIPKHARIRKSFGPALSKSALKRQEPLILEHANDMVQQLRTIAGEARLDLVDWFNFASYDIFSHLFLGEPLDLIHSDKYRPWVANFKGFSKVTTCMSQIIQYRTARVIISTLVTRFGLGSADRDAFLSVCFERFDRRVNNASKQPDLIQYALEQKQQATQDEIRDETPALLIAGGETTPTLLSGLTYLLLKHPAVLDKLKREIRSAFEEDGDIVMDNLTKLQYLTACLDEAARVYPPVAAGVERLVPSPGAVVCGEYVPGGMMVTIPHHATFHSFRNFHRPDDFVPERHLSDERGPEFLHDDLKTLKYFSTGPRSCFGAELARYAMRLLICKLLYNFDISILPESEGWMEKQKAYTFWQKPGLFVKLTAAEK